MGRAVWHRRGWTGAALAAAALACALPRPARPLDSVPLPSMLPSPEPRGAARLWVGAGAHRDWERFEITLSDGTRYARASPSARLAGEVGLRIASRTSATFELTSVGLGTTVQRDFLETPAAKLAAVAQAHVATRGPGSGAGAGLAASARAAFLGVRVVPFARLDAQLARVHLGREPDDGPYNGATRWEAAVVSSAGVALPLRTLQIALAGGWRAVVRAGAFDEVRPADPLRRSGAYAIASVRWVLQSRREGG